MLLLGCRRVLWTVVVLGIVQSYAFGQFGGGSGGFGNSGGFGSGGTGGSGGFGNGSGSSGLGSNLGTGDGTGTSAGNTTGSIFQQTTSAFGDRSFGRLPFGAESNLRGPTANASGGQFGTTGRNTGLGNSGLGNLGAFGLGAFGGNRNRNTQMNQASSEDTVRTRYSVSDRQTEVSVPPVAATEVMSRVGRLPGASKFKSAR